jgi:Cdc6-like AAA superfamily ATPase
LRERVGDTVVQKPALTLVAKKVSQHTGDARQAIQMLQMAIKNCLEKLGDDKEFITTAVPFVTPLHVHRGIELHDLVSSVTNLPFQQRIFLFVIVTLHDAVDCQEMSLFELKRVCVKCLEEEGDFDDCTPEGFLSQLRELENTGLLNMKVPAMPSYQSSGSMEFWHKKRKFSLPLMEVSQAVVSLKEKFAFFNNIHKNALKNKEKETLKRKQRGERNI